MVANESTDNEIPRIVQIPNRVLQKIAQRSPPAARWLEGDEEKLFEEEENPHKEMSQAMILELSDDLQRAVDSAGTPLKMVDPRSGKEYVLVAHSIVQPTSPPVDDLADTYRAQVESAMRAGWNDPSMDEYNDYDSHRRQ